MASAAVDPGSIGGVHRWDYCLRSGKETCKEVGFSAEVPDGGGIDGGEGGEAARLLKSPAQGGATFSVSKCVTTQKVSYAYHMGASSAVANLGKKYIGLIAVADSYHTPNPVCHPYILFTVKYKGKSVGSFKVHFGDGCWSRKNGWTPVEGTSKYGYAYCVYTESGAPCPIRWVFPVFPYDTVVDASLWGLNSKGTYSNMSEPGCGRWPASTCGWPALTEPGRR